MFNEHKIQHSGEDVYCRKDIKQKFYTERCSELAARFPGINRAFGIGNMSGKRKKVGNVLCWRISERKHDSFFGMGGCSGEGTLAKTGCRLDRRS
jgi:hypothetical protein